MSFGNMPIANRFVTEHEFEGEYFFELAPAFCAECGTLQLVEQPDPAEMFHDQYAFFSRTSASMQVHFAGYADWVMQHYLGQEPFVVELGSNDGIMLENFARAGVRHLGVEPSENVAKVAREYGVNTLCSFFTPDAATAIRGEHGAANAIIAANVMCHIPDLNAIGEAADILLKPDGVLIFEDPYLGSMIEKNSYDQLYDEHVYIFSLRSVQSIFGRQGFEVVDVLEQGTHGGSMRYVLARAGSRACSDTVGRLRAQESRLGLDNPATYDRFRENCESNRAALVSLLRELKTTGARIVGYAATSKSTTVLNYCGIDSSLIEYISDTTPIKQGRYTPGTHIPVRPHADFVEYYPDYAVLFAWNHAKEIMSKETAYADAGGKWITFVPKVEIKQA